MHHKKSRMKELARRAFVYALMMTTVLGLLVVLTLRILGYQFNFETRKVEQTGLVQYDSFPRGAMVNVDGQKQDVTQTKGSVLPGQHQFAMTLKGYENWQKTLDIQAGTVTWLSYARLVPTEKQISSIKSFANFDSVKAAPDRKFMAGISKNEDGRSLLVLIDFRDSRQPKTAEYLLDVTKMSGFDTELTKHQISVDKWSKSGRFLLLKHEYKMPNEPARHEWLWIDREAPGALVNISKLIGLEVNSVEMTDGREVYILQDNNDVRRVRVDDGTVSRPLLSGVTWFELYGNDTIAYTSKTSEARLAGVWKRDWQQPTVLATLPTGDERTLHIRVSDYFYKDTVVIGLGSTLTIYRGTLPASDVAMAAFLQTANSFTLNRPVANLQISTNGRFVMAEDDTGFVSYDIERKQASQEIKKYAAAGLGWLDDYHVWQVDESEQLLMQEFDGINSHQLMPVLTGYDALLTQDGKYIYGFGRATDGTVELKRLSMTVSS